MNTETRLVRFYIERESRKLSDKSVPTHTACASAGQLFARKLQPVQISEDGDRDVVGLKKLVGQFLQLFCSDGLNLGDQFIALQKGRRQPADGVRHFGLVVDDKDAARRALKDAGVTTLDGGFLDFRDPWGNRIEIVGYDNIQFTKAQNVLRGRGLEQLTKNEKARQELVKKGMAFNQS